MPLGLGISEAASTSAGTSITTAGATSTSGSAVVLGGTWTDTSNFTSFTDSNTNTWTQIQTELTGAAHDSRSYYAQNITGGVGHTFTLTINVSDFVSIWAVEATGAATTGVLDQSGRQDDVASPFTSPAVTTVDADEFLVGFCLSDSTSNPATHTAGNSFTKLDEIVNGIDFWTGASAYRIVTATGTFNTTFTVLGAGAAHGWIATLKAVPADGQSNYGTASADPGLHMQILARFP